MAGNAFVAPIEKFLGGRSLCGKSLSFRGR